MKDIRLYLGNERVEWSKTPDILLTYERTDYTNPTLTKNSYSKTITIDGTPNNNNIFNHIWNLERVMDDDFTLFNPSQRVDYELYNDDEIVSKGYAKLDSIKRNGYKLEYNITLYGGLGSFFYNLAYDANSDNEKTLADLNYMGTSDPDNEFNFEINKETVKEAWDRLKMTIPSGETTGSTVINRGLVSKWDYINFIPVYGGSPDDFAADNILINTRDLTNNLVRYTNNNGLTSGTFPLTNGNEYGTKNGYLAGTMTRALNEWQTRDIRSYLQIPALSVKGLFKAISDPINNGGFNVVLDEDFFSRNNPYYEKGWITMPLMDTTTNKDAFSSAVTWTLGQRENIASSRTSIAKVEMVDTFQTTPNTIEMTFEVHMQADASASTWDNIYLSNDGGDDDDPYNVLLIQFYVNKTNDLTTPNPFVASKKIVLETKYNGHYWTGFSGTNSMPDNSMPWEYHFGHFVNRGGGDFVWTDDEGSTLIKITMDLNDCNIIPMIGYFSKHMFSNIRKGGRGWETQNINSDSMMLLWKDNPVNINSKIIYDGTGSIRSFKDMTKNTVITLEGTPADWLLSYCKLFDLFFEKDKYSDTIYIKMRNNWYKNEIVDLQDKIDYSKQYDITPLTFETKWYTMAYGEREGQFLDKYKNKHKTDFGKQQINTNYNFDAESIELLEDNQFQNGLTALEKSNYYNHKVDANDEVVPTFLYDWTEVKYFNSNMDTSSRQIALPSNVSLTVLNPKIKDEFYDIMPKLQFHDSEQKPTEFGGVLCFYNGMVDTGNENYWLTDDLDEMLLDGDNPCWLYTKSEYDVSGENRIAILLNNLPEFGRYVVHNDIITTDWNIGRTKELFVPYYKFDVRKTPTIYDNFWRSYINDLYSVNTRKVDIYVNMDTNDCNEFMKRFYWWDNCLWVCTKINDYDVALNRSTLCSFTKVNDKANYLEEPTFDDWFLRLFRVDGGTNIPWSGSSSELTVTLQIDASNDWAFVLGEMPFVSIVSGATSGTASIGNQIQIRFLPNKQNYSRSVTFWVFDADNMSASITFTQAAYVKPKWLTVKPTTLSIPQNPEKGYAFYIDSSANWTAYKANGYFMTLSTTAGTSSDMALGVTFDANNTGEIRTGWIRIFNDDGLSEIITIRQSNQFTATIQQNEEKAIKNVPSSGGTIKYLVVSDTAWTLEPLYGADNFVGCNIWDEEQPATSGTEVTFIIDTNTDGWSKNAYFRLVYGTNDEKLYAYPKEYPLSQFGNDQIITLSSSQSALTININPDYPYTMETVSSWMTAEGGDIDVDENTSNVRNGVVYITYTDEEGNFMNQNVIIQQNATGTYLNVDPTGFTIDYNEQTIIININSSSNVSGCTMPEWVTLETQKNGLMIFNVARNDMNIARSGNIVLTNTDSVTATITITQGSSYNNDYVLDYTLSNSTFPASGGTETLTIRSNNNWTITEQ